MDAPRRILVVDDEASLRTLLRLVLEREGYDVREAGDGDRALEVARSIHPDAVLLDIGMPRKDGWAVLADLRSDPVLRAVPVVMLTGEADESTELRARDLGAVAYVAKPVSIEDAVRVVSRALEKTESSQP